MGLNRYAYLTFDGKALDMPKITISNRTSDQFDTYDPGNTRLDRLSAKYYNDDTYGWLILLANPQYFMEFDIPKNTVIRIPFPKADAESEFVTKIIALKNK